jgi:hypothetical protein
VGGRTYRPDCWRDKPQRQRVGLISEDCFGVYREAKKAKTGRLNSFETLHATVAGVRALSRAVCRLQSVEARAESMLTLGSCQSTERHDGPGNTISSHLDRANLLINSCLSNFRDFRVKTCRTVQTATPQVFRLRANAALNRSSVRSIEKASQQHFLDLCAVFDDPKKQSFEFSD